MIANLAAAAAYVPWLPGVIDDFQSPTQAAIAALAPFDLHNGVDFTARFALGSPALPLHTFFGTWAELALLGGLALAIAGLVVSRFSPEPAAVAPAVESEALWLVGLLAVAAPVGVAVVSLVGDDMYLPRNLATSWPGLAVAFAALLTAGATATRIPATVLVVGAFAYGAIRTTEADLQRPGFADAAAFIDDSAGPKDVVLDVNPIGVGGGHGTDLNPPALTLDVNLDEAHISIDYLGPADAERALNTAAGARLFVAGHPLFVAAVRDQLGFGQTAPVVERDYEGLLPMTVQAFDVPLAHSAGPTATGNP